MEIARELAKKQRSISVAEFFERNKHLLGFDSPSRGIITAVKEAVDNALDACEEAGELPDIFIGVKRISDDVLRVVVEDNGPGIVPEQVPPVFGKLLYGSRFHQIRQSRGQQGIGISAAILYAQLTTGKPAVITTRTDPREKAYRFELMVKTETNEPDVRSKSEVVWDRPHGTRVEIEFKGSLVAKKRLLDYLKFTSVVNPHARLHAEIEGESNLFERVSSEPIRCPRPIQPHPHGIELGTLTRMIEADAHLPLEGFLIERFSRVGKKSAALICQKAGLDGRKKAGRLSPQEQKALLDAMQSTSLPAPPAHECLSPIGEELIAKSMEAEFHLDFVRARTRTASVFSGHPFLVEAAVGYSSRLPMDERAQILRFANRVPLLYQQGACAITSCIANINWKQYGLQQQGLPVGPAIILVHLASTSVPFTSESKDAIAAIPEIEREIDLALKELGRELKSYLSRRERKKQAEDRARAICAIIPEIAAKVSEIVERPPLDTSPIEGRIMRRLVARRRIHEGRVRIELRNYTDRRLDLTVFEISEVGAPDPSIPPDFSTGNEGDFTRAWKCSLEPGASWQVEYTGTGGGTIDLRGIEDPLKLVIDNDS